MNQNIECYYDHYKDTFQQIKRHLADREKFFLIAVLFLFASTFTSYNPTYVFEKTNEIGKAKLGVELELTFYVINSVFAFLCLWFLIKYYQTILIVENLYVYIQKVEDKLNDKLEDFIIDREGNSYLSSYPILKNCIHYLYMIGFPSLVIFSSIMRIYWESSSESLTIPNLAFLFDLSCFATTIIITLLYISWIHFKDFKKN